MGAEETDALRLAYAQHVYKAQGATVERAFVLIGGWQTDRERSYVALSRARERTDIYVCRDDLGEQGMDAGAIERLGQAMADSHAQLASVQVAQAAGEEVQTERELAADRQLQAERSSDRGLDDTLTVEDERETDLEQVIRAAQERDAERQLGRGME